MTSDIHDTIVDTLAAGATYEQAAERAGISVRTLYSWVEKGTHRRKGDRNGPYHEFALAVRRATAQFRRAAAAKRRIQEAEERAQRATDARAKEQEARHTAKVLLRALKRPLVPGDADYEEFQEELAAVHQRIQASQEKWARKDLANLRAYEAQQSAILLATLRQSYQTAPLAHPQSTSPVPPTLHSHRTERAHERERDQQDGSA